MLEICEIFSSIQGEGWRQGIPAVFVRFFGCNLKCKFCDTPQAFVKRILMDEKEITKKVNLLSGKKPKIKNVIITGGEPYIQDFSKLVKTLKKQGYFIGIETNGTIWREIDVDWLCVSPKKAAVKLFKNGYDIRFRNIANEFKYVIEKSSDIDFIDRKIEKPVILQPVDNNLQVAQLIVREIKKIGRTNWFIRLQLHKILDIR